MFQETPIEINSSAKVAYFVGCQSSYSGISGKIAENFAKILSGAKIDFTILGPDEWCCGFPLIIRGALKEEVHIFFENNIHKLEKLGVKEVILSCAGCFRTWRLEYQKFGKIPFKITHYSEFIAKLIAEGHIKPKPLNKIVTYHDPCDLGRICGIFDPPRKIISSIPEITFKELPNNKENSICCGSGGLLKFVHPTIANKILHKKIEDFLAVHPDIVITSCVTCFNTFKELEEKLRIEVWDITDLIVGRSTTK
jgi:heterodisulfide reductase subunit D